MAIDLPPGISPERRQSVLSELQAAGLREVNPDLLLLYLKQYITDLQGQGLTASPEIMRVQEALQRLSQGKPTSGEKSPLATVKSSIDLLNKVAATESSNRAAINSPLGAEFPTRSFPTEAGAEQFAAQRLGEASPGAASLLGSDLSATNIQDLVGALGVPSASEAASFTPADFAQFKGLAEELGTKGGTPFSPFDKDQFQSVNTGSPTGSDIFSTGVSAALPLFNLAGSAKRGDPLGIAKSSLGLLQQSIPGINQGFGLNLPNLPSLQDFASTAANALGFTGNIGTTGVAADAPLATAADLGATAPELSALGATGGELGTGLAGEALSLISEAAPIAGPVIGSLISIFGSPDVQKLNTASTIQSLTDAFPSELQTATAGGKLNIDPHAPTDTLLNQYSQLQDSLAASRQLENAISQSNKREDSLQFPDFTQFRPGVDATGRSIVQNLVRAQDTLQSRGITQPNENEFRFSLGDILNNAGLPSQTAFQSNPGGATESGGSPGLPPPLPPQRFLDPLEALVFSSLFGGVNRDSLVDPSRPELFGSFVATSENPFTNETINLENKTLRDLIQLGLVPTPGVGAIGVEGGGFPEVPAASLLGQVGGGRNLLALPNFRSDILAQLANISPGGLEAALRPFGVFGAAESPAVSSNAGTSNTRNLDSGILGPGSARSSGASDPEKGIAGAEISPVSRSETKGLAPQITAATLNPLSTLDDLMSQSQGLLSGGA